MALEQVYGMALQDSDQVKILHVVPGLDEIGNGIAVVAKLIAREQAAYLIEARRFAAGEDDVSQYDEVWVHSAWLPIVFRSCKRVLKSGKHLVRMSHANYDPVRLAYHAWKKRLVSPIDRYYLRKADKVIATCEAEADWIRDYESRIKSIDVINLKRFFNLLSSPCPKLRCKPPLHILYLGRNHPLKGLEYLQQAVKDIEGVELRVVSNAFGEEKERVWDWCDVLVLPTLTENFGLVIAEALERGKRVITTDGAPAWCDGSDYGGRLTYLKGYRGGTKEQRVQIMKDAIEEIVRNINKAETSNA